jgi:hypothetical protein
LSSLQLIYFFTFNPPYQDINLILKLQDDWNALNISLHVYPIAFQVDHLYHATPELKINHKVSKGNFSSSFYKDLFKDTKFLQFFKVLGKGNSEF